jgi:glycosyltransferase involved in cell wall biosynthesis
MAKKRVNLAPLRFGAGIKGKIADGWWSGTPAITTGVGAEGMYGSLPFGGFVAETIEDLARAAVNLYHDQKLWEDLSRKGLQIMTDLYSPDVTLEPFLKRLHWLLEHRERHRLSNFTGEILWQTGLRATEYFSRWIEEKRTTRNHSQSD